MLTLSEAVKTGRLAEFAKQEEKRGVGPVSKRKLDAAIRKLATTLLKSEDRTSRSASRDGSRGR
jgi:hypothetical protein